MLRSCLDAVVERHEVLRTTFVTERVSPRRWSARFVVPTCRSWTVVVPARPASIRLFVPSWSGHSTWRVARCSGPVILEADDAGVLVLNMHHIVTDGWSIGVLQDELVALYPALAAGGASPLGELPLQYADFAVWQRESLTPGRRSVLEGYWRKRLEGAPAYVSLPYDRAPAEVESREGDTFGFSLDPTAVEAVRAVARAENSTVFVVLLAAYKVMLSRLTGQTDVVVATSVAGRDHPKLDELIGFFVNNLVLRTDLGGGPSFRDTVRRVRQTVLDAQDHQDLPFDMLVAAVRPPADHTRHRSCRRRWCTSPSRSRATRSEIWWCSRYQHR
ncbi:condensation domain-containing protein [Micromonospora sp. M12]